MERTKIKYPGVPVHMDGQEYIVPSLSVRQFREHYPTLTAAIREDQSVPDFVAERVPAIGDALRRNYPELTDEKLEDMIDVGNFSELLVAVQGASGMKAVQPGESTPAAAAGK